MLANRNVLQHPVFDALSGGRTHGIFTAIWQHRVMFVAVFSCIVLLSAAAAFIIPARYLATSMAIVAEADPGTKISDVWAQKQGDPADLESQIMILRSPRLLKLALSQPGALEAAIEDCRKALGACDGMDQTSAKLIEETAKHYSMAAVGRSRVLSISYTSASPDTAMTMANALVTAYLDDQRGTESSSREVAAKWLWQEVADLDREIREKVTTIEAFRRQNGLVQGATAAISSESLTNVSQQLAAAEQSKAQAQAKLDAIRNLRNDPTGASTSQTLENRTVADLKQQIATVANQLAASSTILGARHPQRQMLEASLALLQKQLDSEIGRVTASAQKDYEAADSLVASLRLQVDKAKDKAADALSSESSIEGMLRDVEAKRQLYTQLYQRASELESERRSLVGGARLVSLAEKPTQPYFPKKMPMLAAGFALGLFVAGISCIVRSRLPAQSAEAPVDHRPNVPKEAPRHRTPQRAVELAILGSLPDIPPSSLLDTGVDAPSSRLRRSMASGVFRKQAEALAKSILPLTRRQPLLLLPAEADTDLAAFTALVLARTLSEQGHQTLLIECAPTGRTLSEIFDWDEQSFAISHATTARSRPFNNSLLAPAAELSAIVGADVDPRLVTRIERQGWKALTEWAEPHDVVLLTGPSVFDAAAELTLRRLAATDLKIVLCMNHETAAEQMSRVTSMTNQFGLSVQGAVLLPQMARSQHVASSTSPSGRKRA